MLAFKILFEPGSIFRSYPVREWRRITLWLKWGLIIPYFAIIIRIMISPENSLLLGYLFELAEDAAFPVFVYYILYLIIQGFLLTLVWLVRALFILFFYRLKQPSFGETGIACSLSAASLTTGIWYILPLSFFWVYLPATVHSIILTSYLIRQVNRVEKKSSIYAVILPSMVPIIF